MEIPMKTWKFHTCQLILSGSILGRRAHQVNAEKEAWLARSMRRRRRHRLMERTNVFTPVDQRVG